MQLQLSSAFLGLGLLVGLASSSSAAQESATGAPFDLGSGSANWKQNVGLTELDGQLWAAGPAYRARFFEGGVEYAPILGSRAERTLDLQLQLESISRGGASVLADPRMLSRRHEGARVRMQHAQGVEQRFDLLLGGIEQSFVFSEPLQGDGDLVVRLQVTTGLDLPAPGTRIEGLRFVHPGAGEVLVGSVTGIDAAGERSTGELRFDGQALELVLSDAFLDGAAYPLVLDPLIGTNVSVAGSADDERPNVSYDASTGTYLVCWDTQISLADSDVRAQRVDALGAPIGGVISVEAGSSIYARRPAGGNFNTANTFFVAYEAGAFFAGPFDVLARAIPSVTGVPSAAIALGSDPASEIDISVGSEYAKFDGDPILCLWERSGAGIRGAKLSLGVGGAPQVDVPITVSTAPFDHKPVVSKIDGFTDSWLVVYESIVVQTPGLQVARVGTDGLLVPNNFGFITSSTGNPIGNASLDAMGHEARWLLAYEVEEELDPTSHDVEVLSIALVNGLLQAGPAGWVDNDVGDDEIDPDVSWTSQKFFVAFADESAPLTYDLYVTGINPVTCGVCESEMLVANGAGSHRRPSISGLHTTSTGSASAVSFVAWSRVNLVPPYASDVLGQALVATGQGGATANLGGGCGSAGSIATLGSPTIGDGSFQVQLLGIDPLAVLALLNISPPAPTFGCGSCAWLPFFTTFNAPIQLGNAARLLSVPCDPALVGGVVEAQWTVGLTSSSPCSLLPNFSISDRLRLTIGQ